jgi:hypothetical protein
MKDEDNWTGTPPEGHHPRSSSDPGHWNRQWKQTAVVGATLFVAFVVILLLALL